MKKYFVSTRRVSPAPDGSNYDEMQVGVDVILGEAVIELIESGIDEDAHFWGSSWRYLDDDDIEFAINDSTTMLKLTEYIRSTLVEKLHEVLADRKAEKVRHPNVV